MKIPGANAYDGSVSGRQSSMGGEDRKWLTHAQSVATMSTMTNARDQIQVCVGGGVIICVIAVICVGMLL